MATQYTAGLTTGQVLTAATMNSIGATWETWTPTITASSGAFSSVTITEARYARIQKIIVCYLSVKITGMGTATGNLNFTLPVTLRAGYNAGVSSGTWREFAAVGDTGVVSPLSTTTAGLFLYNNGAYLALNREYGATFIYEAA
jgi:hypothetical protein